MNTCFVRFASRGRSMALAAAAAAVIAAPAAAGAGAAPQTAPTPQMRGDGPAPSPQPFRITRIDPALDGIVAPDAMPETIASGFGINEGVLWVNDGRLGYVLVSSLIDNVMYSISPDHRVSVFMERAGYSGSDPTHVGRWDEGRSPRKSVLDERRRTRCHPDYVARGQAARISPPADRGRRAEAADLRDEPRVRR